MVLPERRVLIVAIECATEAVALRAAAEELRLRVELAPIGEPQDLLTTLNRRQGFDLTVLCCHGDNAGTGIALPELAPGLAAQQPFVGSLTPTSVYSFLRLEGQRVLSLACSSGGPAMAQAFLDAGCDWYLAPEDDPDGAAAFAFAVAFCYQHLCRGLDCETAWRRCRHEDDDSRSFRLRRRRPE